MATTPMMQGFADSEMPDDDAGQPAMNERSFARIGLLDDGSLTVYKETGDDTDSASESPPQKAATIGEALKMILDMYKGMAPQGGDDAFQAGYTADEPQQQRPMGRNMSRGIA